MCFTYTHRTPKNKDRHNSLLKMLQASLKWLAGGEGHAWPVCKLRWIACHAQEQRPEEIGQYRKGGGQKVCVTSAESGVAKRELGRRGGW